jgi:hypothetical protein
MSDVGDCAHDVTNHRHDYDFFSCTFSFCGSLPFFDASQKAHRPGHDWTAFSRFGCTVKRVGYRKKS